MLLKGFGADSGGILKTVLNGDILLPCRSPHPFRTSYYFAIKGAWRQNS